MVLAESVLLARSVPFFFPPSLDHYVFSFSTVFCVFFCLVPVCCCVSACVLFFVSLRFFSFCFVIVSCFNLLQCLARYQIPSVLFFVGISSASACFRFHLFFLFLFLLLVRFSPILVLSFSMFPPLIYNQHWLYFSIRLYLFTTPSVFSPEKKNEETLICVFSNQARSLLAFLCFAGVDPAEPVRTHAPGTHRVMGRSWATERAKQAHRRGQGVFPDCH